ncbi:MAG: pentapeptide repeat-containing protein [Candidatus Halichondribacter symbioticus]
MDYSFFFDLNSIITFIIALLVWVGFAYILKSLKEIAPLKTIYVGVAGVVGSALTALFFILLSQIFSFPFIPSRLEGMNNSNFALAFIGTVSGLGGLFAIYLSILRSDELKRTNDIAIETNKIADEKNKVALKETEAALRENELTERQASIAEKQARTAERQAYTAEQQSITDRLSKATDGLGKSENNVPIFEIRLGSLYELERIAQDSIRDHIRIMETLCSYIRHNSPWKDRVLDEDPLRKDIQTALTIIGRRDRWTDGKKYLKKEKQQGYSLDLSHCDLYGAKLGRANLINANLCGTTLQSANLTNADLSETWLDNTNLDYANVHKAKTRKAFAIEGDFSNCKTFVQEQLEDMYCGINLTEPTHLKRSEAWPDEELSEDKSFTDYLDWAFDRYGENMNM